MSKSGVSSNHFFTCTLGNSDKIKNQSPNSNISDVSRGRPLQYQTCLNTGTISRSEGVVPKPILPKSLESRI